MANGKLTIGTYESYPLTQHGKLTIGYYGTTPPVIESKLIIGRYTQPYYSGSQFHAGTEGKLVIAPN